MSAKIKTIKGREILDSRGFPTVECVLTLDDGTTVSASVPAGTSTGKHEALELRDNDSTRYFGYGVLQAISNIETTIAPTLIGKQPNILLMDQQIIDLDETENKAQLGANTTLAVSCAVAKAQALINNLELYELINTVFEMGPISIPHCMFNILNGGLHADNGLCFQEFMIMPQQTTIHEALHTIVILYHTLKKILKENNLSITVGQEGGFAPVFKPEQRTPEELALDLLEQTIARSSINKNSVVFCLDIAASHFFDAKINAYTIYNHNFKSNDLVNYYSQLVKTYSIYSIEDGMAEDDWYGWQLLTEKFSPTIQLVGDDIFVTNQTRISKGIQLGVANTVLIKPNQIGTILETVNAIKLCKKSGYKTVLSHRSGETNDTFIADLAVGTNIGQFKAGAPARGERVAKYNRLLEIEDKLSH
jgi:enolase